MEPSAITPFTSMAGIMEALPGAKRALFAAYHLGGCQSCAFSDEETLDALAKRSGLDAEEVLACLLASHENDLSMWISPAEALARKEELRWIDIRTREEHEAVVIAGSEFFTQDLQQVLFAGDPEVKVVLYDHRGTHVLDQVAWFRGHGLKETYGLQGGIDAWARDVDPSVRRYRVEIDP